MDEPLFKSAHQALVFAFNYAGQQSPKTPMMSLIRNLGDAPIGNGKGLVGLDGAGQAGMILAAVCRLPDDQHNVIVARYGHVLHECPCCEQDAPSDEWRAAIEFLVGSNNIDWRDWSHRRLKRDAIEIALKKSRMKKKEFFKKYFVSRTTGYERLKELESMFSSIEKVALLTIDNDFFDKKLLVA